MTASVAALLSSSPLILCQGLTRPWRPRLCWHHRSMCAWPQPHRCQGGFRCRYSAWACQCCCGESRFGPCQRLPRLVQRALVENPTEVELERDIKKRGFHFHSCSVKNCCVVSPGLLKSVFKDSFPGAFYLKSKALNRRKSNKTEN